MRCRPAQCAHWECHSQQGRSLPQRADRVPLPPSDARARSRPSAASVGANTRQVRAPGIARPRHFALVSEVAAPTPTPCTQLTVEVATANARAGRLPFRGDLLESAYDRPGASLQLALSPV